MPARTDIPLAREGPFHDKKRHLAPCLLFYLSGDHGLQADYAGANPAPNIWDDEVKVLPGGPKGPYLQCGDRASPSRFPKGRPIISN